MQAARIKAISYYLPDQVLHNASLNQLFPEWSVDKISSKTGIYQRHIAAPDEFSSDMAVKAAQKLFDEHLITPESIDFILLCTQSPDYFLPTTACIIQDRLKIPSTAGAIDFNLGCSGYIYGLSLAKGLISALIAKNILLITSETYSKFIHPKDKSNRTIFGDGASATLVSANEGFAEIGDFELGTDGRGAKNLIVKNGGMRFPFSSANGKDVADDYGNISNDNNLHMNGTEIFNFTSEAVPVMINKVLQKHSLTAEDVQLYVLHQANKYMLNHLRKKMLIPEERFYYFLENCGNTVSSTIPIALYEASRANKLKGNIVLAGFGVGYSWGACVITIK
ncbi:3-oxoacyl-ACP synthase [Cytophagales bacterium WSM2-2]|nr:3-oxoacyl-ACP synthase [Cytophagales bacterium WSM2-2]